MKIGYLMEAGVPDVRSPLPSGPAIHVIHTIRELIRLGHHVRLVAKLNETIWTSDDLENYRPVSAGGLPGVAERLARRIQWELRLPYLAWFDGLRFAGACRQELNGFDVLYERMGWMGRGGSMAARSMGIPHVLEVNGDHPKEHEMLGLNCSRLQTRCSMCVMRKVARGAAHSVSTGEGWRRRHLQYWQIPAGRTSVIQNGSQIVDLLGRSDLRCFGPQASEPEDPLRLIYVGSFDPWQSLPMLLRAVARVRCAGTKIRVTLAGSGKMRAPLEEMAADLQIGDAVTFAGHLPIAELAKRLAQADIGVALYGGREEFDGLKLLDYKSAGLATIATGKNGEPSVLRHGITGIIIPPGDEDALVRAVRDLDQRRMHIVRMGRQARQEAEQQHSWRHTARALESLFHSLINQQQMKARAAA